MKSLLRALQRGVILAGLALPLAIGCKYESSVQSPSTPNAAPAPANPAEWTPTSTAEANSNPVETAEKPAEPAKIGIQAVDKAGYDKVLQSLKGKVVLVDFWATWCAPCRKAFPHTVDLHRKYGPSGLVVVTVSMDDQDAEVDALEFLEQQKAEFTNLRSKLGAEAEAVEAFEIDGGAIPHLKLFDRSGKLHKKFASGDDVAPFGPEDVEAAVRELLAAPK